jgi:hypothetical protein
MRINITGSLHEGKLLESSHNFHRVLDVSKEFYLTGCIASLNAKENSMQKYIFYTMGQTIS